MLTKPRLMWVLFGIGLVSLLIGLGAPLLPLGGSQAQTDDPPPLIELNEDVIKRATVFVMQTYQNQNQTIISCVGSGTLISPDGLILTNAHTALSSETCRADQLVIALTVKLDEPPIPTYTAEVLNASRGLDLAVLRVDGFLDGRAVSPDSLQLPFVELGDSAAVALDNTITITGYPDFGKEEQSLTVANAPVTMTRGTISGFTAEARVGDRAWIRTSAEIPGTMTGGGAYNRDGKLIGIPTIAPARVGEVTVDCRVIQDTNLDGRADSSDNCVPIGGFISALRPSRLARGLVRAATLDIRPGDNTTDNLTPPAPAPGQDDDGPAFDRLFFTTSINQAGVPSNVVGGVPAGTTSLYLFFDYANMQDGMVYELKVTVDDIPDKVHSLPPVTWNGGERGTWHIGSSGTPWQPGTYAFRLFIEGREANSASIRVGAGVNVTPSFSDIVFGVLDQNNNLVGTNYVLPEGSVVQARFTYRNMEPDIPWTQVWYKDGRRLEPSINETWPAERGAQGTHRISAQAVGGQFEAGEYRLELYVNNRLSATADFVVAGGAELTETVIFSDFRFASQQQDGVPVPETVRAEFSGEIEELYIFFDWRLIAPGTMWTRRWLVDGEVLFEVTEPWVAPPDGENFYFSLTTPSRLLDGTYGFEISIANISLVTTTVRVGLGQLPVNVFESAEGVQMTGRIIDTETGKGIPGALFIVLKPEFSIEDFLWDQSQVLGMSLADNQGYYQVPQLLPRGDEDEPLLYSILVQAEGYMPVNADGIVIGQNTASPVEINVKLTRN